MSSFPGINQEDSDSLDRLNRAGIEIPDATVDQSTGRLLLPDYAKQYLTNPPVGDSRATTPITPTGFRKPVAPVLTEEDKALISRLGGAAPLAYGAVASSEPADETFFGAAKRGIQRTLPELAGMGGATVGLIGDAAGIETLKHWGLEVYKKRNEEAQKYINENDSFTSMWDSEKGSFKNWLGNTAGYVAGQALETVAAALVGSAAGSLAAPGPGTAGGAILGAFSRTATKKLLASSVEKIMEIEAKKVVAEGLGMEAARVAAQKAGAEFAGMALKKQAAAVGSGLAMYGVNATQELGSIYPEAIAENLKNGGNGQLDAGDLFRVGVAGLSAAAIETIADKFNLKLLERGAGSAKLSTRVATQVPLGMVRESGTEGVQTIIERLGANQEVFGKEGIKDIIDSMAVGMVGGGGFGGIASLRRSAPRTASEVDVGPSRSLDEILRDIEEAPVTGASVSYPGGVDFSQPNIPAMKAENMALAPTPTPAGNEIDMTPFMREQAAAKAQAAETAISQEGVRQADEAAKIPYVREDLPNVTSGVRDNLTLAEPGAVGNEIDMSQFLAERAQGRAVKEQPTASQTVAGALPSPNSPASTGAMVNGRRQTFEEVARAEIDRARARELGTTPTRLPTGAVPEAKKVSGIGRGAELGVPAHTVSAARFQASKTAMQHLPQWTSLKGLSAAATGEAIVEANGRSAKSRITSMAHALGVDVKDRPLPEVAKEVNDRIDVINTFEKMTPAEALKNPAEVRRAAKLFGIASTGGMEQMARSVVSTAKESNSLFFEAATKDSHKRAVLRAIVKDEYVPLDILRSYPDIERRFGRRALKKAREAGEKVAQAEANRLEAADASEIRSDQEGSNQQEYENGGRENNGGPDIQRGAEARTAAGNEVQRQTEEVAAASPKVVPVQSVPFKAAETTEKPAVAKKALVADFTTAQLKDMTIEIPVQVEEDGQTVNVKMNAATALKNAKRDEGRWKRLMGCVSS